MGSGEGIISGTAVEFHKCASRLRKEAARVSHDFARTWDSYPQLEGREEGEGQFLELACHCAADESS